VQEQRRRKAAAILPKLAPGLRRGDGRVVLTETFRSHGMSAFQDFNLKLDFQDTPTLLPYVQATIQSS
jgi:hypothetical protein